MKQVSAELNLGSDVIGHEKVALFALEIEHSNLSEPVKAYLSALMDERETAAKQQPPNMIRGLLEREGFFDNTNPYGISDADNITLHFGFSSHELAKGADCPSCHKAKLHVRAPLRYQIVDSLPGIIRFHIAIDVKGCTSCGNIFHAPHPHHLSRDSAIGKCTARAAAEISLRRFEFGIPNKRQESISTMEGVSLPRTTQHGILAEANERLRSLSEVLQKESANATLRVIDDRAFPIIQEKIAIREEIKAAEAIGKSKKDVRHGIHSTIVKSVTDQGHVIVIFDTGREHQGNIECRLQKMRTNPTPMITVSDLSSAAKKVEPMPEKNALGYTPTRLNTKESAKNLEVPFKPVGDRGGCWSHAYLHLAEATDAPQCKKSVLIEAINALFAEDEKTRTMNSTERYEHHQQYSRPIVDGFFVQVNLFKSEPEAEPNSAWGQALRYLSDNILHFRLFLDKPGIPIHSNEVEALHLVQVRHQNNSQHYQTLIGAQIGDNIQSLVRTAMANGENPFDYLTACLENYREVGEAPSRWLPWNFREALGEILLKRTQRVQYTLAPKREKRVCRA
jgi:transposase